MSAVVVEFATAQESSVLPARCGNGLRGGGSLVRGRSGDPTD